jgi:hypothetical protein
MKAVGIAYERESCNSPNYRLRTYILKGTQYRSWFRHNAKSRKVSGSINDEVIWFINLHNTSSCTMALGSTQPLIEKNTKYIPGRKVWLAGA